MSRGASRRRRTRGSRCPRALRRARASRPRPTGAGRAAAGSRPRRAPRWRSRSWTGRRGRAADSPTRWRARAASQPRVTTVSLLRRIRTSPRARSSPALHAAAKPRFSGRARMREAGVPPRQLGEKFGRPVRRAVVHDHHLETRPLGAREEALQAQPVEHPVLVGHDHDGGEGEAPRERGLEGGRVPKRRGRPVDAGPGALPREARGDGFPAGISDDGGRRAEAQVSPERVEPAERGDRLGRDRGVEAVRPSLPQRVRRRRTPRQAEDAHDAVPGGRERFPARGQAGDAHDAVSGGRERFRCRELALLAHAPRARPRRRAHAGSIRSDSRPAVREASGPAQSDGRRPRSRRAAARSRSYGLTAEVSRLHPGESAISPRNLWASHTSPGTLWLSHRRRLGRTRTRPTRPTSGRGPWRSWS